MKHHPFDPHHSVSGLSKIKQAIIVQVESGMANYVPQQLIIRFNETTTETQIRQFLSAHSFRLNRPIAPQMYVVESLLREPMTRTLIKANQAPAVIYAEPNYLPVFDRIPTDAEFTRQWALHNTGQSGGIPGMDIQILNAWDLTKGTTDTIVAVIDSGFDINHMEFRGRLLPGWNFLNNNPDVANTATGQFHGTAVAGVIAAAENGISIVGVAPNVTLLPLIAGPVDVAIRSIIFAHENGANIINLSFGYEGHVQSLKDVMSSTDALFVCSAGNEGINNDTVSRSPANYHLNNQLTVSNVNNRGELDATSSFSPTTVDLAAPGVSILTTAARNMIVTVNGTSFSTPMVAGVAALIDSIRPDLPPQEVKQLIADNVTKLPPLTEKVTSGGMLNAAKALQAAMQYETITPSKETLLPPLHVRILNPTETSLTVAWEPPADATPVLNYEIFRDDVQIATVPAQTHIYTDVNVMPNTIYNYVVRSQGLTPPSPVAIGRIEAETTPPQPEGPLRPPVNLRLTGQTATSISLAWQPPESAISVAAYEIFRDDTHIATVAGDVLTYTDTNLTPETTYRYTVRTQAFTEHSNQAAGTTKSDVTLPDLSPPTHLKVTATTVTLTWQPAISTLPISGYYVYRNERRIETLSPQTTQFIDTELTPNTTYRYWITAFDAAGKQANSKALTVVTRTE